MFAMTVEDVFVIKGRGVVATGRIQSGSLQVGDEVTVNGGVSLRVEAIEAFRRKITVANAGDDVGVLFGRGVDKAEINRGDVLTAPTVV
jgi:translation elongation factor EF-Tu-like GTPase